MKSKIKWVLLSTLLISICMSAAVYAEWLSFSVTGLEYTRHNAAGAEVLMPTNLNLDNLAVGDTIYLAGIRNARDISAEPIINIDKSGAMDKWQDEGAVNYYSRAGVVTHTSMNWYMSDSGGFTATAPGMYRVYVRDAAIGVSPIFYFYVHSNNSADIAPAINLAYDGEPIANEEHLYVNRYDAKNLTWSLPPSACTTYISVRYRDANRVWRDLPGYDGVEVKKDSNTYTMDMKKITADYGFGRYQVALTTGNGRGVNTDRPVTLIFYTVWHARFGSFQNGQMEVLVTAPTEENPDEITKQPIADGDELAVDRPMTVITTPDKGYYTAKIEAEKRTFSDADTFTSVVEVLAENTDEVTDINYHVGTNDYSKSDVDEVVITPYFEKESYRIVFYDYDQSTVLFEKTVTYGESFPAVDDPVRDNHTFLHWARLNDTGAPETYTTTAVADDLGDNGATVSYYAQYRVNEILVSLTPQLSKSILDIGETVQLVVTANYVNEITGENVSKTVVPESITADKEGIVSVGTLSEATEISALAGGTASLTIAYSEWGVLKTETIELAVVVGQNLGNVLEKSVACVGATSLKEETLSAAKNALSQIENVIFVGTRTENGTISSQGVYTPIQKTTAGTFADTLSFYAKNEAGETIANGRITVSYTVTESLILTASPQEIAMGAASSITAEYVLANGYSETVDATITLSRDDVVRLEESTLYAIGYGSVTITAIYGGLTAQTELKVALPEVIYLPDGTTALYTQGAGMTVVLEEYANYFDYYNVDDEEIFGDTTPGGEIVVARVYLHDRLSFNTVGVSLAFDPDKLVPMNPSVNNGTIKAKYGETGFKPQDAITATRAEDTVFVATTMTDAYGNDLIYGCIGSTGGSTVLSAGENVQVMSLLFAKVTTPSDVDETALDFYSGEDETRAKTYKTNWIDKGKAVNQITGLVTPDEVTISDAFAILYPAPVPVVTLESIRVRADKTALVVGDTTKLYAEALYSDGTVTEAEAVFTASIGTISGNTYTALAAGEAVITATYEGMTANLTITVSAPEITVIRGDVNCDGEVRMNDLVLLLAHLSSGAELSAQGMKNADVTEDGRVLMNDLVVLLTYLSTGGWK